MIKTCEVCEGTGIVCDEECNKCHGTGNVRIRNKLTLTIGYVGAKKEPCKHYDREEINLVLDGKTPPIVKCKICGEVIE